MKRSEYTDRVWKIEEQQLLWFVQFATDVPNVFMFKK